MGIFTRTRHTICHRQKHAKKLKHFPYPSWRADSERVDSSSLFDIHITLPQSLRPFWVYFFTFTLFFGRKDVGPMMCVLHLKGITVRIFIYTQKRSPLSLAPIITEMPTRGAKYCPRKKTPRNVRDSPWLCSHGTRPTLFTLG